MMTGSAPIEKNVIDYLKICFSCPILEGYGLTESAAATSIVDPEDSNTGHVGGPVESVKFRLRDIPEMSYLSADKPYPRGECCMMGPCIFKGYFKYKCTRTDRWRSLIDQKTSSSFLRESISRQKRLNRSWHCRSWLPSASFMVTHSKTLALVWSSLRKAKLWSGHMTTMCKPPSKNCVKMLISKNWLLKIWIV